MLTIGFPSDGKTRQFYLTERQLRFSVVLTELIKLKSGEDKPSMMKPLDDCNTNVQMPLELFHSGELPNDDLVLEADWNIDSEALTIRVKVYNGVLDYGGYTVSNFRLDSTPSADQLNGMITETIEKALKVTA